jgi:hypothetical protein
MKNLLIFCCVIIGWPTLSVGQTPPTYLGSIDPHESSGIPYADVSSFIVQADSSLLLSNGYIDVLNPYWPRNGQLIRVDLADYSVQKIITRTGPQGDFGLSGGFLHTDGYLYISGEWADYTVERMRPFIAKYTKDLEEVWINYLPELSDTSFHYYPYDLCSAFDGDILMAYNTQVEPKELNIMETHLLKVDTSGFIQWNKHLPDTTWISIGRGNIIPTDDGHYLVSTYCGERLAGVAYPEHFILHKVDEEGEIVWTRYRKGYQKKFQVPRIADLPGGGAVMAVVRDTLAIFEGAKGVSLFYYALEAFSNEGQSVWIFPWFKHMVSTIEVLHRAKNDDILGCGYWFEFDDPYRGWVFRFSPEGELKWSRLYNDAANRPWTLGAIPIMFVRMTELNDGRIAITGWAIDSTDYPGANGANSNVLLMILDSMGCLVPGCEGEDQVISSTEGWQVIQRMPLLALQVSPNPAKEHIILQWPEGVPLSGRAYQLMAFDDLGRQIWSGPWHGDPQRIDTEKWPPGYATLVCIQSGQPVVSARILIAKK